MKTPTSTTGTGPGAGRLRSRRGAATIPSQRAAGTRLTALPSPVVTYVAAGLRIAVGWVFLWAFADKAFGLGHETPAEAAWVDGGSPTEGFLGAVAAGPFQGFYNDLAGAGWVDWLFMAGLLGIGLALTLGVTMRIAAAAGALLLVLMWSAVLPPEHNPFMDFRLVYAGLVVLLAALGAGRWAGLGGWWERRPVVRRHRWLI